MLIKFFTLLDVHSGEIAFDPSSQNSQYCRLVFLSRLLR